MEMGKLKAASIEVYRMMSIMPLIFIFDLAMCILVPIYLFIVFRDKLMSENTIIANLVDLE